MPNTIKTIRDSDPPWMNDDNKNKVKLKHKLYHYFSRHKTSKEDFAMLEDFRKIFMLLIFFAILF